MDDDEIHFSDVDSDGDDIVPATQVISDDHFETKERKIVSNNYTM